MYLNMFSKSHSKNFSKNKYSFFLVILILLKICYPKIGLIKCLRCTYTFHFGWIYERVAWKTIFDNCPRRFFCKFFYEYFKCYFVFSLKNSSWRMSAVLTKQILHLNTIS